jgi:hypoxanthine-DNA glycosylase
MDYTARVERALERGLGLWDVYASCVRVGSLDRSIEAPLWNDLSELQRRSPALQAIAHNGGESARAMRRTGALGVCVYRLPSSSPANASWSFERKLAAWRVVFEAHEVM